MFPLGSALLPYAAVPLHVFEERYRQLMRELVHGEDDPEFGTVLIERGSEVGGREERFNVGALARILESRELDDGRWVVVGIGLGRLRVVRWLPDAPYPRALVEDLADAPFEAESEDPRQRLSVALQPVLDLRADLEGREASSATAELDADPVVATWQAAWLGGLQELDALRLLEEPDPAERLERVCAALTEIEQTLRFRLTGS